MNANEKQPPLISPGSLILGTIVMAFGIYWSYESYNAGAAGWSVAWPVIAALVVGGVINMAALASPNGSVFDLCLEIFHEIAAKMR